MTSESIRAFASPTRNRPDFPAHQPQKRALPGAVAAENGPFFSGAKAPAQIAQYDLSLQRYVHVAQCYQSIWVWTDVLHGIFSENLLFYSSACGIFRSPQ